MQGFRGALVIAFFPLVLLAQANTSIELTARERHFTASIKEIKCGHVGADLDVVLEAILEGNPTTLKATLSNYRTVKDNAAGAKDLVFKVNDRSVGNIEFSNDKETKWNLRPSANSGLPPGEQSQCEVSASHEANAPIRISMNCKNLLPEGSDVTLQERVDNRLASLKVNFSCETSQTSAE